MPLSLVKYMRSWSGFVSSLRHCCCKCACYGICICAGSVRWVRGAMWRGAGYVGSRCWTHRNVTFTYIHTHTYICTHTIHSWWRCSILYYLLKYIIIIYFLDLHLYICRKTYIPSWFLCVSLFLTVHHSAITLMVGNKCLAFDIYEYCFVFPFANVSLILLMFLLSSLSTPLKEL